MKLLFLCLTVFVFTKAFPLEDSSPISVAVLEYQPIIDTQRTKDEQILANAEAYIEIIETVKASSPTTNLIIFPEDTLTNDDETSVETSVGDNPCDLKTYPKFVENLSCAVRANSLYVVVNFVEKVKCGNATSENCENFGYFFYNTDFLFDRDGTIVNKYHKYNLFGEKARDRPDEPEVVVFETDFGKFGVFTCFDILFKSPAQDVVAKGVDAVIFPTMWFSELPFLTSLQTQQMWAQAHNITLLASGANNPLLGSGGSGFYDGQTGLISGSIDAAGGSQILIHDYPPKAPAQPYDIDAVSREMDSFYLKPDPSLPDYNSTLLDATRLDEDVDEQVCHGDFCCDFSYRISEGETAEDGNSYTYHLVAFAGTRHYPEIADAGLENCGIVACVDASLASCGRRFPDYEDVNWPITFEKIGIRAVFEKNENKTQFPNSLLSSIRPISGAETAWAQNEVEIGGEVFVEASFEVTQPQNRLLTFAVLGRSFAKDSFPDGKQR